MKPHPQGRSDRCLLVIVMSAVASWLLLTQFSLPVHAEPPATKPTLAAQITPTPSFSVTVHVTPAGLEVLTYQQLTVTVAIERHGEGCVYLPFDLTLSQPNATPPIFTYTSPAVVGPPVSSAAPYTLTAQTSGTVTLMATAFGEQYCGNSWFWHTVSGVSPLITVTEPPG